MKWYNVVTQKANGFFRITFITTFPNAEKDSIWHKKNILMVQTQQTFVGLQDVLKTSSARLQCNNFTSSKMSWRHLEDVFKTSRKTPWRHLQDVLKTSWKTKNCYAKDVLKTSSRRLEDRQMFAGILQQFENWLKMKLRVTANL